jgi:hypothetical protein
MSSNKNANHDAETSIGSNHSISNKGTTMTSTTIYTPITPYCVYHTIYSGSLMPQNYIGSTSVDKIINKNYHGSVSSKEYKTIWKSELKNHPELFNTYISSYHATRNDALYHELKIQQIFTIVTNPNFINKAYVCVNNFYGDVSGANNPNFSSACKEFELLSPNGTVYKGINIKQFCLDKKLNSAHICQVLLGNRPHHKGWTSTDTDIISKWVYEVPRREQDRNIRVSNTLSKKFSIVDPHGNIHTGMNLVKFCKDNNLTRSNICKVIVGTRNHHKGWTKLFP